MGRAVSNVVTLDGRVWTGRGGETFRRGRVIIADGRVKAVGALGEFPREPEGSHIDCGSRWIIPGLVDTHTHLVFGESGRSYEDYMTKDSDELMLMRAARNAGIHRAVGVTTLRDSGARNRVTLWLKEGIERGYLDGPRILACGRPITPTGGHFWWCNQEADGADGVRRAVRELVKDGVDFIKIMASGGGTAGTDPTVATFTAEEMGAIVSTAADHGLLCSAHCEATAAVERAVTAGVDSIEHAGFREPDGTRTWRQSVADEMARRGLSYSPTIQTGYRRLQGALAEEEPTDELRRSITAARYKLSRKLENLGRMMQAGVRVIAGTDAISEFGDYVLCLELFVHAGMTPEEALLSGTSRAAEAVGLGDEVGRISPGSRGDLVMIDGDHLQDVSALRNVAAVYQDGITVEVPAHIRREVPDFAAPGNREDVASVLGEGR